MSEDTSLGRLIVAVIGDHAAALPCTSCRIWIN